ncbi:hypothetical protein ACVWYH_004356 [Bradyrhizobium sp. GM24.11]
MTLSVTEATSPRRTGAPLRQASTMSRYSEAWSSWSLASMVRRWPSTEIAPFGRFCDALTTAARAASSDRFMAASRAGDTWMRTALRSAPLTMIRATPGSCDSFGEITPSARL